MESWLKAALNYVPEWLQFQMQLTEQPGCVVAVASNGRIVLEEAFGFANIAARRKLTTRHRFRIASHSKTFTAAAVLKLCEEGLLRTDDSAGLYVRGLHPVVAETKISQLLSHSGGLTRDGYDAPYWQARRPFLREKELRMALREPPTIEAGTRFKYSNHGFGLIGLIIESVSGEPYCDYVQRVIVKGSKLLETLADGPAPTNVPTAQGYTRKIPLGYRVTVPDEKPTHALAPATGFLSTAADLALFFATLDSNSKRSVLSRTSRNELTRIHWEDVSAYEKRYYGLGVMLGKTGNWDWFGHMGAFPGFLSRTVVVPKVGLSVSLLTNSIDGPSSVWSDAILHILQMFSERGAPSPKAREWKGRWWDLWRTLDFVPMGDRVLVGDPGLSVPFRDASEIALTSPDRGIIRMAPGLGSFGEDARLVRDINGLPHEVRLGGMRLSTKNRNTAQLKRKYRP